MDCFKCIPSVSIKEVCGSRAPTKGATSLTSFYPGPNPGSWHCRVGMSRLHAYPVVEHGHLLLSKLHQNTRSIAPDPPHSPWWQTMLLTCSGLVVVGGWVLHSIEGAIASSREQWHTGGFAAAGKTKPEARRRYRRHHPSSRWLSRWPPHRPNDRSRSSALSPVSIKLIAGKSLN